MSDVEDLGWSWPASERSDHGTTPNPSWSTEQTVTPPTVLFVDDEEDVLAGLRLSLRRERRNYNLLFANSADEAVAILDAEPVDMVVTDMRMPDRSGVDLLDELRFRFPDVIRYVLSGQAEDRLVRRSVAVTHRWLSKPCEPEVLLEALAEATGHRSLITDPAIRRAVGAIDALPSHPNVHARLVELLGGDDAEPEQIAALVAGDPGVMVKLLQWVNSAFADTEPIYDARRTVDRIGLEALSQLAPANDIIRPFVPSEVIPGFGIDLFHRHSRAVSALAAGLVAPEDRTVAATGGLLCHVGLLVEASQLHGSLDRAYERATAQGVPLVEVQRTERGSGYPELGAHLLALWGLPRSLVQLVAKGHDRPDPNGSLPLGPVEAVRAARLLAARLPLASAIGRPLLPTIDDEVAAGLDRLQAELDPDHWEAVIVEQAPLTSTIL